MSEILELKGTVEGETLITSGIMNEETLDDSIYAKRMNSYYPEVIKAIVEFQALIKADYPEFDNLNRSETDVVEDAWLLTMNEERIEQWEKILGIKPIEDSSVDDRRDTVIARIRGQGKLNTALINAIVNAFTGGSAKSWVANSTLYVTITQPPHNKQYQFANVKQELSKKIPAHLGLQVSRNYYTWGDIKNNYDTWNDVETDLPTWDDVYLFVPFS